MKPEGIRDIKGLFTFFDFSQWAIGAFFFLLGCGLLAAFLFWWRRKKTPVVKASPVQDPYLALAQRLEALSKLALSIDQTKPFHFELSEIIRQYVELRFSFPATDRTVEEINEALNPKVGLSAEQKQSLMELLKETDRVKFTDWVPQPEMSRALLHSTIEFTNQLSRPNVEDLSEVVP